MIGILMEVLTRPGRADEFAGLVAKLQADVRENEPDVLIYQILRDDADPARFVFVEVFATEEAFAAHPDMPYHKAMAAAGWDCVEGQPVIRRFSPLTNENRMGEMA